MSAAAKPKYRTTNWKKYNAALKARGSLFIWRDKDRGWHGSASGKRGCSQKYSEAVGRLPRTAKLDLDFVMVGPDVQDLACELTAVVAKQRPMNPAVLPDAV
jgi:hypothetical protein